MRTKFAAAGAEANKKTSAASGRFIPLSAKTRSAENAMSLIQKSDSLRWRRCCSPAQGKYWNIVNPACALMMRAQLGVSGHVNCAVAARVPGVLYLCKNR